MNGERPELEVESTIELRRAGQETETPRMAWSNQAPPSTAASHGRLPMTPRFYQFGALRTRTIFSESSIATSRGIADATIKLSADHRWRAVRQSKAATTIASSPAP